MKHAPHLPLHDPANSAHKGEAVEQTLRPNLSHSHMRTRAAHARTIFLIKQTKKKYL